MCLKPKSPPKIEPVAVTPAEEVEVPKLKQKATDTKTATTVFQGGANSKLRIARKDPGVTAPGFGGGTGIQV